jgi:hypothetical protein
MSFRWYRNAPVKAWNQEIKFTTDTMKATLHTSTYTPNQDTHAYVSDLSNELTTANGYTVGGLTLASCTVTYTAANSWSTTWQASTAYAVDFVIRPASGNGFLYRCAVAGTSSSSAPTWPTVVGTTVTDGGVTWECIGSGIIVFNATSPSWATSTFGPCRYLVISDRTPGTAATQPLMGYFDFGSDKTGQGGAFTFNFNSQGIAHIFVP